MLDRPKKRRKKNCPPERARRTSDRRKWNREFTNDEVVTISISRSARVLDESAAGLGLLVADAGNLQINESVEILDQDGVSRLTGRIANLHRMESGQWRLGIELKSYHLPGVYDTTSE